MRLALCLFKYYPFGGLERDFLQIAEEALRRGHEVNVYAREWSGPCPAGLQLHLIESRGHSNHARCKTFVNQLKVILAEGDFDLVVGFNRMPGLDLYFGADVCFEKQSRVKRSWLYRITPRYRIFSDFERAVFSPTSKTEVMYITSGTKEEYQEVYATPDLRFHELPPGIDKVAIRSALTSENREKIRKQLGVSDTEKLLLMVGSDFHRKGVHRAVTALSALPEAMRVNTKLLVIGKGKAAPLQRYSKSLGIGDRVIFVGPQGSVPLYLAAADLLLHVALVEAAGNVILEGLVAGLPVIVTHTCGFSFHVEKANSGRVIGNPEFLQHELNDVLAHALESPDLQQEWRTNALKYADRTDLYSRHMQAVSIIEHLAMERGKSE